jgi:hypothetical protein
MTKLLLAILLLVAFTPFVQAEQNRASMGNDITIAEGESAGNVACAFCSVHVHGDVKGNVAVFMGNVSVDPTHSISGHVAIFGGDLNLGADSQVLSDVAIFGGNVNLSSNAEIHGDRSVLTGRFWLLLPFLPLFVVIGIIWLVVHLIRRNRYQFPAYPNGRGIGPR